MKIRISQHYLRDLYLYYVTFNPNTLKCIVKRHCSDNEFSATLTQDYKKIIFDNKAVTISGLNGEKPKEVRYLRVPKDKINWIKLYITE